MDWNDIRYLLALSRCNTLTKAAAELGVVRTTVGRRLDALESSLGVRLFDRTPEGFVPTAAGLDLAEVATRMESDVLAAEGRVRGRDAQLRGRLRVATLDFVFQGFAEVFKSFGARYPGVELTVCASTESVSLRRREADVALRLSNTPPEHLIGHRLGRLSFAPYCSRELHECFGPAPKLGVLPWLLPDERDENPGLERWLAEHAPGARTAMRFNSYPMLRTAIKSGIGVGLMACLDGAADPDLVCLVPSDSHIFRELWALTLPELRTNSRVRTFRQHLREELAPQLDS